MPTYEYQCGECGHAFEAFQKMSDPRLTDCPACGAKNTVKRLISAGSGLIFKGSGFYITDYKNAPPKDSGAKSPDKPGDKPADKSGEKAETKGDTKAETKTESATPAASKSESAAAPASNCGNVSKSD